MNAVTLLKKKRLGLSLSRDELAYLVNGFTETEIPDYQMSAFLMAVCLQGMSAKETADLVDLMLHSGDVADLSCIKIPKVDKHSTGGIGDKTTFLLAPILASCGFAYPTLAGRTLAHTGGTIDKLESIPGFDCSISLKRFSELVATVGLAFMGQTEEICPADRKIYALRDVTGTIESTPLIVASILSKKLAEGAEGLLFDVKTGSGAFMKSEKEAKALAKALVQTAKAGGRRAKALVTDMGEPLGHAVGNAIEVNECVAYLRRGPRDQAPCPRLESITTELAIELIRLGNPKLSTATARTMVRDSIQSGHAYSKFLEIVSLQGGNTEAIEDGLPLAPIKQTLRATKSGYLTSMDGESIGLALVEMGGGRKKADEKLDHGVGFWFHVTVGQKVKKNDPLVDIFARNEKSAEAIKLSLSSCIQISGKSVKAPKLIRSKV